MGQYQDANIIAFAEANENIKDAFNRVFFNYKNLGKHVSLSGICCFTESLPEIDDWKYFRKGFNGIVIEYNKDLLKNHFLNNYVLGNCFTKVEYLSNQIVLKSSTPNCYDILWKVKHNGDLLYKSIQGDIERDEKEMEKLIFKLLTRINIKYQKQKELRIILGGRNIPDKSPDLKGYKILIPHSSIVKIHTHPKTPLEFVKNLHHIIPNGTIIKE